MSHPSPELILEVNIFERLEHMTNLTLGQLTLLRIESRQQQQNLLFIAYEHQHINEGVAREIARDFNMDVQRAPWVVRESTQPMGHPL